MNAWGTFWGDSWGASWGPLHEVEEFPKGGGVVASQIKKLVRPVAIRPKLFKPSKPFALPPRNVEQDEVLFMVSAL